MRKLLVTALATLACGAALVFAVPGPANAADPADTVPDASCLYIGTTFLSGRSIQASGGVSSCHGTATLDIQRSRWFGWETVASAGPGVQMVLGYDCSNTGTHDFRAIVFAWNAAGTYIQKDSNTLHSVTC